jgi:hypothetical protein
MQMWLLGAALWGALASGAAAPTSVTGTWNLATNVAGNTGTPTCTFKQEAEKITGTCSGPNNTQSEVSGEVTDTKVTFRYNIEWEGNPLTLVYTGTLDTETTMKGAIDVQPMNVPGEFTATKAK